MGKRRNKKLGMKTLFFLAYRSESYNAESKSHVTLLYYLLIDTFSNHLLQLVIHMHLLFDDDHITYG